MQDNGLVQDGYAALAEIRVLSPVSIVIPTYREAANIPHLLARIDEVRRKHGMQLEVLFMDDDSNDGSVEAVACCGFDWARMIVRKHNRGLSPAVIEGFRTARHPVLVCMDCDLSHPPEIIPQMLLALSAGQQCVLGSRYVPGGSTDDDWGMFRFINSAVATLLARPLTAARDPMSGFFALRKSDFDRAQALNPVGYKIALELIVKCGFENVAEIPIHFSDRIYGESKLSLREQLKYLQHIRRLYLYRFERSMNLLQFLLVGMSGTVVNLVALTLLLSAGVGERVSLAGGIAISVCTNFLLNRRFTFSYAQHRNVWHQFAGYIGATCVGMAVNYTVSMILLAQLPAEATYRPHLAALVGIPAGMTFNYLGSRFIVFRRKYYRPDSRRRKPDLDQPLTQGQKDD